MAHRSPKSSARGHSRDGGTGARVETLPGGLRVITDSMPRLETTSIGVWVDAGSRHESLEINGISHLLEHMAFKGTERRSARAIAEEVEAVGGHLNAYTSSENTAYLARVLKDDVGLAVDILADILQNSVFDSDELARERAVVVQEIGQTRDTPDDLVFEFFQEAAYPEQPLGRSILGAVERVGGFERETLMGYMAERYRAPRMVAVAAGAIEHERFVDMIGGAFAALGAGESTPPAPARYVGGERRTERDLEQVHLVLGFNGVAYGDPRFYAAQVYSTILGGGMSSRLFQEVREKRGLAYAVYSFTASYMDGGTLGVYAGTGASELASVVPVISDELNKLAAGHAEEAELSRARAQLKAGLVMSLESSMARCEQLGRQMLIFGRPIPTAELLAEIDAVDEAAVTEFARGVLDAGPPVLSAIGPLESLESYDQIASRFS